MTKRQKIQKIVDAISRGLASRNQLDPRTHGKYAGRLVSLSNQGKDIVISDVKLEEMINNLSKLAASSKPDAPSKTKGNSEAEEKMSGSIQSQSDASTQLQSGAFTQSQSGAFTQLQSGASTSNREMEALKKENACLKEENRQLQEKMKSMETYMLANKNTSGILNSHNILQENVFFLGFKIKLEKNVLFRYDSKGNLFKYEMRKYYAKKTVHGKTHRIYLGECPTKPLVESKIRAYCRKYGIEIPARFGE